MLKSALLAAIRQEIHRHGLWHFQEDRVVPGCPQCRKRFYTVPQFIDHLTDDVLPPLLIGCHLKGMAETPTNGGGFTRVHCENCKQIQPEQTASVREAMDLVCQVCHSVIATLFKEGFAASA